MIEFRNVAKRFNEKTVFERVNCKIYENQITSIIGKSGSGKSVLLKHIIGLLSPDEGDILFRGKSIHAMRKLEWESYRSKVSYMFQGNALFDSMTVFDNVALPLRQTTKLGRKEIEQKVIARLEQVEILDAAQRFPSELSGGMQKRVALARALVTDPTIVLFDEPTTGQDPIRKNAILSMIAHYRKQLGFTAVLISHDIPDVFFISDRILLLWDGTIAFSGTYEELSGLKHPLIDEFLISLEGLQDELTGLLSREIFKSRYTLTLNGGRATTSTAVVFAVHFDLIRAMFVPQVAAEGLKILGEYVNSYFGPLGGFSARHRMDSILTVLPHIGIRETEPLVDDIAKLFQNKALSEIQEQVAGKLGVGTKFKISVSAGITEALSTYDIEQIITKAETRRKIIARYSGVKEVVSS